MPRPPRRLLLPGYPLHVLQRGHNRARVFESDADHVFYLGLLQEYSQRHGCAVHAYVLMTNHVHLLISPPEVRCMSEMMRGINQVFVQRVNRHQGRCGSVWQGRPKACLVDSSSYLLNCYRYIELNPVRAAMVASPALYPWSSYSANASGRVSELVKPHRTYLGLGATAESRRAGYRGLFDETLTEEQLGRIRTSVTQGWPLGDDAFIHELESLGIKATPDRPGRPKSVPDLSQTGARPGPELGLALV
jgi:putative transposase